MTTSITVACVAALASLVLLAVVRGNLLAEQIKDSAPVVVFDDAPPQPTDSQNSFYDRTIPLLQLIMALLALAMELGAGLTLHEAWRLGAESTEDWNKLRKRLADVRGRLAAVACEITTLQNQPQTFSERFWRNFYHAMLAHTVRSAMTKLLLAAIAFLMVASGRALAQRRTTLVIAVDLTQSVAVGGPDGKSEFQKNIEAVTQLLAQVPADSRVTVIAITDHSFAQPDILLSATIPAAPGYFGERLTAARSQLVRAWKIRGVKLSPRYRRTDIIGALVLAGQIFDEQGIATSKILVIFSDMRDSALGLDLESAARSYGPARDHRGSETNIAVADLRDVNVCILGVDGAGRSIAYWQELNGFWAEYLRNVGSNLRSYSALRGTTMNQGKLSDPK